ncbi:hypothetical protein [Roseivirga misakiensis]|uniref:Uncharacterized protein n=1 Tax=Roseivirga misakiensis TaxID=1563681 RepID=A0A1E5SZ15_9BACT|nr:hypothetical protein [Roseivirga misakiensis]OEK04374.1 hypothetical protein BFP71_12895 [Roseivirga misakiensis]
MLISSCNYEFPIVPEDELPTFETADLSNVVFIGSSAFSGITDGVLVPNTSLRSIPQIFMNNLLKNDLSIDLSATSDNQIGFNIYENSDLMGDMGPYRIQYASSADTTFIQKPIEGETHSYLPENDSLRNFSFPQAQLLDFTENNRSENPFLADYFNNSNNSILDQIIDESPSFFVIDLGFEGLMGYAFNGAEGDESSTNLMQSAYEDVLDPALFEQKLSEMTDALLANNSEAKGVLFNIPSFLNYPFFNMSDYDITPYICTPNTLNIACAPKASYNTAKTASVEFNRKQTEFYLANPQIPFAERRLGIHFDLDSPFTWGVIVEDNDLPDVIYQGEPLPRVRQMFRDEIIFYRNEYKLGDSKGHLPTNALTERDYLKVEDIERIEAQIQAYNQAIASVVSQSDGRLVLFDYNAYFDVLFSGLDNFLDLAADGELLEGAPFLPILGRFGIFSADGINLNPRGNALITNQLIETINEGFGGNLKKVNPNDFAGTQSILSGN